MRETLTELAVFTRRHWLHAMLSPFLGFIACSALHEASHADAAAIQGATITEFVCWPGNGYLGHVSYDFPEGVRPNHQAILVAPYITSFILIFAVLIVARCVKRLPFWLGSTLFVWGWIASFGNLGIAVSGYLRGNRRSDLAKVLGHPEIVTGLLLVLVLACGVAGGYWIQRRLYGTAALSGKAYAAFAAAVGLVIAVAAAMGRLL